MKKNILFLALLATVFTTSCAKNTPSVQDNEPATISAFSEKSVVKEIDPDVSGVEAFEIIKKNYEGKVVLVDFWATWCGPCRMAMKEVDKIKPSLMERGAAFVYITGETSPLETWQQMVPGIEGDHYRLTKEQWSNLCKTLNIPGIPAYVLFNADGTEAFSNINEGGYPGNELIENVIEVALTK